MVDILDYSKGRDYLENREEFLFKLISELDKASYDLFGEIVSLSSDSYYKIDNLLTRVNELSRLYNETKESYVYINKIEQSSYDYAAKRFQMKRMLTAMTTIYAFVANALLGILAFVLLNDRATKDFCNELDYINERIRKFDENELTRIKDTIENCSRILSGKIKRMENESEEYNLITAANSFIYSYIEGLIEFDIINSLNDDIKKIIINILKNDLESESENLFELLERSKEIKNNGLKLFKEYK